MKQRQRRLKKQRKRQNKEPKESKKERHREERKEQERDIAREIEKGGDQKRLRRNKGRHSKINKKCPLVGGKQFFLLEAKERKGTKKTNKKQGGFRAK